MHPAYFNYSACLKNNFTVNTGLKTVIHLSIFKSILLFKLYDLTANVGYSVFRKEQTEKFNVVELKSILDLISKIVYVSSNPAYDILVFARNDFYSVVYICMFLCLLRNCVRSSFFVFCFVPIYLHVFAFRMQHKVKGGGVS